MQQVTDFSSIPEIGVTLVVPTAINVSLASDVSASAALKLASPMTINISTSGDLVSAFTSTSAPIAVPGASAVNAAITMVAERGPAGPPGPISSGAVAGHLVFLQPNPATVWVIVHNFGYNPSVTVVDSGGSVVVGNITYIDLNTLNIAFSAQFSGTAYIV